MNYLLDNDFLYKLYESQHREIYAKIISLTQEEYPIEEIQGKIQNGGNINLDGKSSLRRTCQLSLISTDQSSVNNYAWTLNNKFRLEIGLKNKINKEYPEIIWFNQGIYIITSFSSTLNQNSCNINISGKDKMCRLNGECGGLLPHTVDFGIQEETDENGNIIYKDILIKDIIREAVQNYGNELPQNIIINDLNDIGVEILEYRGNTPLYLFKNVNSDVIEQMTLNGKQKVNLTSDGNPISLDEIERYDNFCTLEASIQNNATQVYLGDSAYTIAKIETGQVPGYRPTDLTFAGELIGRAGESLTSVLDKIVQMLGEFEYFYDIYGRFIFQKKKNYIDVQYQSTREYDELRPEIQIYSDSVPYSFLNSKIISSFQNSPNLLNLKNDYSIWGTRTTTSGLEIPIHLRYGIGKKPTRYTTIRLNNNLTYISDASYKIKGDEKVVDWRELIYQMAKDYRKCYHNDNFLFELKKANPQLITGKTGYEQYYTDLEGFWRELYNPFLNDEDFKKNFFEEYKKEDYNTTNYWSNLAENDVEKLNFWFDLLEGNLSQFSVEAIGDRTKVVNETNIKSIYYRDIPNVIFVNNAEMNDYPRQVGYTYIQLTSNMAGLFTISSIGISALDKLKSELYNHSYCVESSTIQCLPVYHLQPNTRIFLSDNHTNISGEYTIDKISIPLSYNGMMTINAVKIENNIS